MDNHNTFGYSQAIDMYLEHERMKTFKNWPVKFLPGEQLARNGFYYVGHSDIVRCAFCKVEIHHWEQGDNPAKDHERWAPHCRFVRELASWESDKMDKHDTLNYSHTVDMRHEHERMETFKNWPVTFLTGEQLARNGFYYLGDGDRVRCAFCKVEMHRWEQGDNPAEEHKRWAPQCPFVRKLACLKSTGPYEFKSDILQDSPPRTPDLNQRRYASDAAQLQNFQDRLRCIHRKPKQLGNELADFFRIRQGDKTKCFYCDSELKDLKNNDVRHWEQLAQWSLEYVLKMMKDDCSVSQSDAEKSLMPEQTEIKQRKVIESPENSSDDSKICKICYDRERNVCFLPCRHFVACSRCALTVDKCPVCRNMYDNVLLLYYS